MAADETPPTALRGNVIRPVQFQGIPEQKETIGDPSIRVQVKVAATPEKLGQKITRLVTTQLRSAGSPVLITNSDPIYRILIDAFETRHPPEVVIAAVFTAVVNLSAISDIDLSDEKVRALGLTRDQANALRQLKVGANLHQMALEHGLRILYSSGGERRIEPYESVVCLGAWKAHTDDLAGMIDQLLEEFRSNVLDGAPEGG